MLGRFLANQFFDFVRNIPSAAEQNYQAANTGFTRKVVCYNQGQILNYWYDVNETHKNLKNEYHRLTSLRRTLDVRDIAELEDLRKKLIEGMRSRFKLINHQNFSFMHEVYKCQSFGQKKPRFCIKTTYKKGEDDFVVTLDRDDSFVDEKRYKTSQSKAFSQIRNSGKYYICNNIPGSIKKERYFNSRINIESARKFYPVPWKIKNFQFRHSKKVDYEWRRYWIKRNSSERIPQEDLPRDYYYKSTLIIPIALDTTSLSADFLKDFDSPKDKISLGFLCMDHENINFFNEKDHVDVGYFFADIISLYMYAFLKCTVYSSAFKSACQLLKSINSAR
ncbi:hypothetical protein [Leptothoe sp. PORK10 BA2]|uniref:hypothetical protein n=1 Tax=Leptothoe sp. PORK10 BA2 TaxID=3110254 RepID=UPI002B20C710|nr:hypothetical protein [Leptothoe sp. PORK10 BA2]MEA5464622.1 hypothetical protein [Leptothoe sp. PORK10 BA2]